jgi:hypothetical protein
MRGAAALTGIIVAIGALAGCGYGGSPVTASTLRPASAASAQPSPPATLAWVQRDCLAGTTAMNDVAGPLERQDAAGVVAADKLASSMVSSVDESVAEAGGDSEIPMVAEYTGAVLEQIVAMGEYAQAYADGESSWSLVSGEEGALAADFKIMKSECSAASVAMGGDSTPGAALGAAPSSSSAGCPSPGQLLTAWNAVSASAQGTWVYQSPTGFEDVECWKQWITAEPVIPNDVDQPVHVIFTDNGGEIAVLPGNQAGVSEFETAVCGNTGAPRDWTTKADGSSACT